jgi:GH25 family lysozyme M1 (1,4-beta-N-acetylmuramidase)
MTLESTGTTGTDLAIGLTLIRPTTDSFVSAVLDRVSMRPSLPFCLAAFCLAGAACAPPRENAMGDLVALDAQSPGSEAQAIHEVCPSGETTYGIDVSYYQGDIDWQAARNDGVRFAFIRVSDGTGFEDPKFQQNWDGARAAGILRGVYQFFRSDDDPIAQADLLLTRMGTLEPDDLPPVADVESTDGVGNGARVDKLRTWLDRVEQGSGAQPIIYTGGYFWQDNVGTDEFNDHPLWHAGYTGGTCPSTVANQWPDWTFWQFGSTGSVAGISGNVDENRFNGSYEQLLELTVGDPVCGDGRCSAGEGGGACVADCPVCEPLAADGGVVTEAGPCFRGGGPQQYLRTVDDAGEGGGLVWTHTTDSAEEANFAEWTVLVSESGRYRIEAYTDAAYAQSVQSKYLVNDQQFVVDQTAVDGWNVVAADVTLSADGANIVHVGDNTGEPGSANVQQVYDALRLVRLDVSEPGEGEGEGEPGEGEGEPGEGEGEGELQEEGPGRVTIRPPADPGAAPGCASAGTSGITLGALALLLLARRRLRPCA